MAASDSAVWEAADELAADERFPGLFWGEDGAALLRAIILAEEPQRQWYRHPQALEPTEIFGSIVRLPGGEIHLPAPPPYEPVAQQSELVLAARIFREIETGPRISCLR